MYRLSACKAPARSGAPIAHWVVWILAMANPSMDRCAGSGALDGVPEVVRSQRRQLGIAGVGHGYQPVGLPNVVEGLRVVARCETPCRLRHDAHAAFERSLISCIGLEIGRECTQGIRCHVLDQIDRSLMIKGRIGNADRSQTRHRPRKETRVWSPRWSELRSDGLR